MLFLDALATRVLVCDGATGSLLYDKGVFVNQSFEALNLTRSDLVRDIHRAYVDAGADVIETNTFGANAPKLGGFGLDTRLDDINAAGVRLAREAVGSAGLVAGAMGPLGVGVGDNGPLSPARAGVLFSEQAAVLIDGGVDLVMLETFDRLHELEVATHAVGRLAKVPVIAQMSTGQDGCSRDGVPPEQFAERLAGAGASMVGVNCGGGPAATLEALERMATRSTVPLSAQPNAGGPRAVDGRRLMLSSPDYLASYARRFVAEGAGLVGGCCGTTPAHIACIKQAVSGQQAPRAVACRSAGDAL